MTKIWLVYMESNIDGELWFDAIPCSTLEKARKVLEEQKKSALKETHFGKIDKDEYEVEETEDRFFVNDPTDDYYEDYKIVEKKLI